jgi:hypothetical protein
MGDKFMGRHIMPFFENPPLEKGGEGDFFEIFIHKISPNPSFPKRGRLWGFVTSKIERKRR